MRIAFIYDCAYPYVKGGVERRIFEISRRLAPRHHVHLITMRWWRNGKEMELKGNFTSHGVCPGFRIHNRSGKRRALPALIFSISLLPSLLRLNPDIIDCQNIPYLPILTCKLFSLIRRKPLIITWHEVWGDYWKTYLGWMGYLGKLIERITSRLSDHNIANSHHTLERFKAISPKPITLIPPGVDLERIRKTRPSRERFDILFTGRLIPEKNVETLLRIVSSLEGDVSCGIIGDGPQRKELERLADRLGISGKVKFLGFVDEVYPYMKSSRVLALPSRREGFGMVVLEANACGLPVVVLSGPHNAAAHLIENGKNGFVCRDEDEMREKIEMLLNDEKLWEGQRRYAFEMASKYSWDRIVGEYERFIRSCLDGS